MGFLNPLWLLLGAAVAIPLILHLLQRHQGPRVIFPAVRYLLRAEREHARRIRLRQLLLLLLRLAIILALAFAAARPFLRGAGADHEPSAVVIILDNSMSSGLVVGDRRVLDELKDRALQTLTRATTDDRFWLLRAGSPDEPALPGDATTTMERVRATQPTKRAADIVASVARAREILKQGAEARAQEIEVLSDLQVTNLRGRIAGEAKEPRVVMWSPKREQVRNASVVAVSLGGGLAPRAGERSTVVATIGGNATDSVNVRLNVGGRVLGAAVARSGSSVAIPFPPHAAGMVSGNVEVDADALRADDRRYFLANIAPPPRVWLTRPVPFLSEGLDVLAGANRIVKTGGAADVMIAPGGAGSESAAPGTGIVLIAPESPLELPAINRRLTALGVNWQLGQKPVGGELKFAAPANTDELSRALASARVMQSYALTPTRRTADSVLLHLEDNSAWAVRGVRANGGRFILLASPLVMTATNLPATPAMIPLLDRATGTWLSGTSAVDPDSLNFARAESDLRYADGKRAERALAPLDVKRVGNANSWSKAVFTHRIGKEIWRYLLFALLLMMLVESVVAATGGTRAPTAD